MSGGTGVQHGDDERLCGNEELDRLLQGVNAVLVRHKQVDIRAQHRHDKAVIPLHGLG